MEQFLGLLIFVGALVAKALDKLLDERRAFKALPPVAERSDVVPPLPPARTRPTEPAPRRPAPSPSIPELDPTRAMAAEIDALAARTTSLAITLESQRSARRLSSVVTTWAPDEIAWLRRRLASPGPELGRLRGNLRMVSRVLDEVDTMAADRRDPRLAAALGDADMLASACYQPIVAHARAEALSLTAAEPATRWGAFDLAIWTGLVPTGVAPIFLPQDFFARAAWWPAIAHEIGHNFVASVRGLDARLRAELGLPTEKVGQRPLVADAVSMDELARLRGGWFEELFCDVFGTLMCGPAYVRTMITLFSSSDPHEIITVDADGSGERYDVHPPRQLRVIAGCRVLERSGLAAEGAELRREWDLRHAIDGAAPDRILLPTAGPWVAVPLALVESLVTDLVDRLCVYPFDGLGGFGLSDVSGLDYGPHAHAESKRAREDLLAGRVPTVRDPRAVIAGAVLAAHARPAQEERILAAARAAIPALGTGEVRPDAYQRAMAQHAPDRAGAAPGPGQRRGASRALGAFGASEVRDALMLREILARPRAVRGPRRS